MRLPTVKYVILKCRICGHEDVKVRFLAKSPKPRCPECSGQKFDKKQGTT